ncbi:hypothetical protein U1Q18_036532, partial [Sarracenia purpurea var. burkii]
LRGLLGAVRTCSIRTEAHDTRHLLLNPLLSQKVPEGNQRLFLVSNVLVRDGFHRKSSYKREICLTENKKASRVGAGAGVIVVIFWRWFGSSKEFGFGSQRSKAGDGSWYGGGGTEDCSVQSESQQASKNPNQRSPKSAKVSWKASVVQTQVPVRGTTFALCRPLGLRHNRISVAGLYAEKNQSLLMRSGHQTSNRSSIYSRSLGLQTTSDI